MGLGRTSSHDLCGRSLASFTSGKAHQLPGADGRLPGIARVPSATTWSCSANLLRQHDGSCLFDQTRRNSFKISLPPRAPNLGLFYPPTDYPSSDTSAGGPEFAGGCCQQGALSTHEMELDELSLQRVFHQCGTPDIDVFAMAANKKCALFCTRGGQDPRSLGDGLLLDWTVWFLYVFPLLPLIP